MAKGTETKHDKIQTALAREAFRPAIEAGRQAVSEIKRAAAALFLRTAEGVYLRAHGWRRQQVDLWTAPDGARKGHENIDRSHAINSQKKTARGGSEGNDPAPTNQPPN